MESAPAHSPAPLVPPTALLVPPPASLVPPSAPLVPPLALAVFIACVAGAAALANCAVLAALFKRCRNSVFSVILHLAVADLMVLATTVCPELWMFNERTWTFGSSGCVAYQGFNIFTSTASSYLIATLALHSLAISRIEERTSRKRRDRSEDEEMKTSQRSLVANSDSSTPPRTMNVDYRVTDIMLPATLPTVFVWVLSASLSIPLFVLSAIIRQGNALFCSVDPSHSSNVYSMLIVFTLFLPMFLMITLSVLLIVKLKPKKRPYALDACSTLQAIKLALCFVALYVSLCVPRSILNAYITFTLKEPTGDETNLFQNHLTSVLCLAFSSAHLLGTLIRPCLCIIILPELRKVFSKIPS